MPNVDKILAYENGSMPEDEMLEFFQEMVNDGSVWYLQGHYGRTAVMLMTRGKILPRSMARRTALAQPPKNCAGEKSS